MSISATVRSHRYVIVVVACLSLVAGASLFFAQSERGSADRSFGTDAQEPLFADGLITPQEHQAAIEAVRSCVAASGVWVGSLRNTGRRIDFAYGGTQSEHELKTQQETYAECFNTHARDVVDMWTAQNPQPSAEADRIRRGMAECLRSAGIDIEADVPAAEVASHAGTREFYACSKQFRDERGILEF